MTPSPAAFHDCEEELFPEVHGEEWGGVEEMCKMSEGDALFPRLLERGLRGI
jgi:hypothetical protein